MRKEEKQIIVERLIEHTNNSAHLYLTDISTLNAEDTSKLRRMCYNAGIKLIVAKNTLVKRAFDVSEKNLEELYPVLKNNTAIMFSEVGNAPAKLIKKFRKESDRPILKGAYVEESVYIGDEQLDVLASIKSKEELIGDIVLLLQSPMKNVISSLQSGKNILAGLVKTLSERE